MDELEILIGHGWKGEMIVYNYDKNVHDTLSASLFIQLENRRTLSLIYRYPEHSENVSRTSLDLNKKGSQIGTHTIISKTKSKKGVLTIKTQSEGKIERQKVNYYYTYKIGANIFSIKREIYFQESDIKILANDFLFKR